MTKSEITGVKQAGAIKYSLGSYEAQVEKRLDEFQATDFTKKIWNKDASAWSAQDEAQWLGWLDVTKQQLGQHHIFTKIADEIRAAGFTQALLLGMGGSSLCVEVIRNTFGANRPFPDMHVLDSTVPAQVSAIRKKLDLARTVMIVASKSGSTTEPNVMCQYFYDETKKVVGAEKVGQHFIAITDPGSSMEKTAAQLKFRAVYHGLPSIGGRFSALSNFGMVPSAVMGVDVAKLLHHAQKMVDACGPNIPVRENPGAVLGTILGVLAKQGRDKVTVITSPSISSLGAWLEQLIAESTGKEGTGLIPVAGEQLCSPDKYGQDRLFAYVRLSSAPDAEQESAVKALETAGHPVVRIEVADKIDLGAEFYAWEFATAVAGSILGINAFNQPNVQESKDYTKKFLAEYTKNGTLPEDTLLFEGEGIKLFVDEANKDELEQAVGADKSIDSFIKAHLKRIQPGDYFAINAYIDREDTDERLLQVLRSLVQQHLCVATTVGFGPRFLHSTGQLHKGGPNSGVFLQITSDDNEDVAIPGEKFSFGTLKQAQSLGDFLALSNRKRRLLRVHLPAYVPAGIARLQKAFENALV